MTQSDDLRIITIPEFLSGTNVLLTGGSGFIGKVLIEKLLRSSPNIGNIYVLMRNKREQYLQERIKNIIELPLFDILKKLNPQALKKIIPINGDMSKIGLGLNEEDRNLIVRKVSVIFHIAASVRFDDPLKKAIVLNVRGTREIISLSETMQHLAVFVHVSTAYSNCNHSLIEEVLYSMHIGWKDAIAVAEEADDQVLQILTDKFIKPYQNTYIFSKALAEHVVNDMCKEKLPAIIMRPSIVVPSVADPFPGWTDNFNGPFSIWIAVGMGFLRVFYGSQNSLHDYVSVDNFVRSIIIAAWQKSQKSENLNEIPIYNCCTDWEISPQESCRIGLNILKTNPFAQKVWIPSDNIFVTNNWYAYFVAMVLFHLLPALLIDGLILLFQGKHIALKVQRRIYIANNMLCFFIMNQIVFKTDNYNGLPSKLLEKDKQQFDIVKQDIESYAPNVIRGMKKYLRKEKPDASERTFVIDKGLKILDRVMKIAIYTLILYILYSNRQYALNLLDKMCIYLENL